MAVKKHFSLTGSNSTVISWIFYEKAEQKSLLKTNKQTQQKTKQTTTCCCQVPVTHKPRDYRAWPRCTWEDLSWHLPCTIREFHCLAIITLVGEWEREKGIQLPATLLKMYNCEEEMYQTRKREQEEKHDSEAQWWGTDLDKENPRLWSLSQGLWTHFIQWMFHIVVGQGARNKVFSALPPAD